MKYKAAFVANNQSLILMLGKPSVSKMDVFTNCSNGPIGMESEESILQLVQIYFDTATLNYIERDKKIKGEAQFSLIGGTMGLLTGLSI